jgi:hypothetical protein
MLRIDIEDENSGPLARGDAQIAARHLPEQAFDLLGNGRGAFLPALQGGRFLARSQREDQ